MRVLWARVRRIRWTPRLHPGGEPGRSDFVYGRVGENFIGEKRGDDEVCIGDRYQVDIATFEVMQPRVTWFYVGFP